MVPPTSARPRSVAAVPCPDSLEPGPNPRIALRKTVRSNRGARTKSGYSILKDRSNHKERSNLDTMRTITCLLLATALALAQSGPKLNPQQQTILDRIKTLRSLSDSDRRVTTRKLALAIRDLPANTVR